MERNKSQFARLMAFDQAIRGKRYPNCLSFSGEWEVSPKTVQRDIDFLRDQCGAPVDYDRERKGFFYRDATWMLPSVMLSEGELLAVLLGSRAIAQYEGTPVAADLERVFSKLAGMLPDRISIRPEMLFNRFTFTSPPAKPVNPDVWATLVQGVMARKTVRVCYRPFDNQKVQPDKESRINPYHIANLQGEWYLFGVHDGHQDVRQFAMARFESAVLTESEFAVPLDFDPARQLAGTFGRYAASGITETIKLLFARQVAEWVTERVWHPEQKLRRHKTGEIELEFQAKGLFEVQRWVLSWGQAVRVLGPEALKASVADEIRAMAENLK
jgi:predicted DNA-binding transcriptional regulator YafY